MPRGKDRGTEAAKRDQRRLLWAQLGETDAPALHHWDPDTSALCQAVLEVLATGATVVFRPGSGGRSVGVAIWEGDDRHPPTWLYEDDELTAWARKVCDRARGERERAAD